MRKFLSSTAGASFNQEVATQTICVRKDLCNGKTKLTKHDIMLNLTQSEEEAKKLYELDTWR